MGSKCSYSKIRSKVQRIPRDKSMLQCMGSKFNSLSAMWYKTWDSREYIAISQIPPQIPPPMEQSIPYQQFLRYPHKSHFPLNTGTKHGIRGGLYKNTYIQIDRYELNTTAHAQGLNKILKPK
jgi:hypothetical protein